MNKNEEWASIDPIVFKKPQIKLSGWEKQDSVIMSNFHCWPSPKEINNTMIIKNDTNEDLKLEKDSEPENETGENHGVINVSDHSDPNCLSQHQDTYSKLNTLVLKCNTNNNDKIHKKFRRQDNLVLKVNVLNSNFETIDNKYNIVNRTEAKIIKPNSKWSTIKSFFTCVKKLLTIEVKPLNTSEAIKTHINNWENEKYMKYISSYTIKQEPSKRNDDISFTTLKLNESKIVKEALDIIIM